MPARTATKDNVKIKESEDHGKTLVAAIHLEPEPPFGFHVFTDEALLVMPTRGSEDDKSGTPPKILEPGPQMWTDWWTYLQQPDEVRQRILSLYTDMDCPHAAAVRNYLLQKYEQSQEEKRDDDIDKGIFDRIEEFTQFAMVIRFNSVELNPPSEDGSGPGADFGHGLFEIACRMNHSCKPNCVWITSQDGKTKEVRAVKAIEEGDELTIDYVGEALEPTPARRKELMTTKGFVCQCDRCAAEHDDTRRFRCVAHQEAGCTGAHLIVQPDLTTEPILLPCDQCGKVAPSSYMESMLIKESELVDEINTLNRSHFEEDKESAERIENLEPPHQLHSLAEKCYELQGVLFSVRGEYKSAAEAYAKQLRCRTAILGDDYHSQASAFCCERLGDALRHVNLEEAEEAYKRTVRHIHLLRGGITDPYSKCAMEKLLDVQNRKARSSPGELPRLDSLHGLLAAVPGPGWCAEATCDMCGNPAQMYEERDGHKYQYCCEQHKKLHFPLAGLATDMASKSICEA